MTAATLVALVGLAVWIHLLRWRGRFWDVGEPPPAPLAAPARIVAVIPARDEAAGIGQAVASLLAQDFPGTLEIVLVDDQSTDGTAEIARAAALGAGAPERLTILEGKPLPEGWSGKLWAVSQGLAHAATLDPDWLLLTDADIGHLPGNVAGLVGRAQQEGLDLASEMVLLRCESFAECALIPAFVFFFFMLYPPAFAADPKSKIAGAAGGCMLVRPAALARIGGIAAIKGALIDDCALAAAIKRSGGRIRLDLTRTARSLRPYEGWQEIWAMVARTAFTQLDYSGLLLAGTVLGLAVTYLAPPLILIFGNDLARLIAFPAWVLMGRAYLPMVRFYGRNSLWAAALPAIAAFYAAATIGSAVKYWRGEGGEWKGRVQARP